MSPPSGAATAPRRLEEPPPPSRARGARLGRWLPAVVSTAAFVHAAALSWRKLGSLLVDSGRELDVPYQLLQGRLLYRDVRFYWGPLGPYLNAALYRAFGVSIDVQMWAGIVAAALAALALYRLSARFLGRLYGTAAVVGFIHVGAFGRLNDIAIFNYVLPFNCDATYGMVAALWSLALLLDHHERGSPGRFRLSAVLLGLTALAKIEVLLPTAAAHLVFAVGDRRRLGRVHAVAWGGVAAAVALVYAAFASRVDHLWSRYLRGAVNAGAETYIRRTMGLADLGASLTSVGWSLLALATIAALVVLCGRALRGRAGRWPWVAVAAIAALAFGAEVALGPDGGFRAMPLVLALSLAAVFPALWRGASKDGAVGVAMALAFGVACYARIPLRATTAHYGFYLLPPSFASLGALAALAAPAEPARPPWMRRASVAAAAGLVLGLAFAVFRISSAWYALPQVEVRTARGTLLVREGAPEPALVRLLSGLPPHTRAVAITEGIGLVFASGLDEGDAWVSYLPMHLQDDALDRELADEWRRAPPDVVLYWDRDLRTLCGVEGFGRDYARRAGDFLAERYRPVADVPGRFVLLERAR